MTSANPSQLFGRGKSVLFRPGRKDKNKKCPVGKKVDLKLTSFPCRQWLLLCLPVLALAAAARTHEYFFDHTRGAESLPADKMDFHQFTVLNEGKDFGSYLTCHCPSLSDCISGADIARRADKKPPPVSRRRFS